jgi:hypothetical protein
MTGGESFDLEILDPSQNEGYLDERLPSARDREILDLISGAGKNGRLRELSAHLSGNHVPVLLAFAERMAALAVRNRDPEMIRRGLLAACLTFAVGDRRDALLVLPLLWRSAERLLLDPASEFAAVSDDLGCDELSQFARRDPEDRSIESMGYVESQDDDGFRYERTW